jgi:hypothetical protein
MAEYLEGRAKELDQRKQCGWIGTRAESALNCGFGATAQAAEPTGFTAK